MSDRSRPMCLEADQWLAGLFGHPVFRVKESWDATGPADLVPRGDAFLFARVLAGDVARVHRLAGHGFRVVDLTLRFTRLPSDIAPTLQRGLCVREARVSDYDGILAIAEFAFRYSRFHLDPLVPRTIANDIKRAWMQSYRDGRRGAGCLVAIDGPDGKERVAGFLGRVETRRDGVVDVIDLIAVDEHDQGKGVGRALVETFAHAAAGRAHELEVGTQAANVPSVRLYEACGFTLASAAYVLHAHFRDGTAR